MSRAVLLVSHGTVDELADLAPFLTNVRRGHAPPQELVNELRRRYQAIGGRSPLNSITAEIARKLAWRLSLPVAWANRLWKPYVSDVVAKLGRDGVHEISLVALAQHSAHVYAADARRATDAHGLRLVCAPSWGSNPRLCAAFATRIVDVLRSAPDLDRTLLLMTAHSLPRSVIVAGDPYERDLRASAEAIAARVCDGIGRDVHHALAFQSQGLSGSGPDGRKVEWLGPDLRAILDSASERGKRHVVFAPVGFLADHIEILYDLDIEGRAMAAQRGMSYARSPSLNADDDFIEALADVSTSLLRDA